jgi:hypothetical protein
MTIVSSVIFMLAATLEINAVDALVLLRNSSLVTPSMLCSNATSITVEAVGERLGESVGTGEGMTDGGTEGCGVGDPWVIVGCGVGLKDGSLELGCTLGRADGSELGTELG